MSEFKKVIILNNEVEAKLMEAILKEKDIPHVIRSYHDTAYDGIYQFQRGWGHIEAHKKYEKEIMETYKNLKENPMVES